MAPARRRCPNAFTFQGDPGSAFDPILFPVVQCTGAGCFRIGVSYNGPAREQDVRSRAGVWHQQKWTAGRSAQGPFDPYRVSGAEGAAAASPADWWAASSMCQRDRVSPLVASIRVTDVTKQASSFGVGVPAARLDDFDTNLVFMGVPADSRFRCKLRLYSLRRGDVLLNVTVNGTLHQVDLKRHDDQDLFEPTYWNSPTFPRSVSCRQGRRPFASPWIQHAGPAAW